MNKITIQCANLDERYVCLECGYTYFGKAQRCKSCGTDPIRQITMGLLVQVRKIKVWDTLGHYWTKKEMEAKI